MSLLLSLVLMFSLFTGIISANAEVAEKTITVDANATEIEGEKYTTIQAAINYICDTYYNDKVDYTYTDGKPETVSDNWYLQAQYGTTWKYREYPSEMSGWTIVVESGTYSHFSIYEGLDGITIKAAENATVTVNTWTGATNDEIVSNYATKNASAYRAYTVTVASRDITIDGLNFTVGEYDSGSWCRAAVTSTSGTTGTDNTGLTIKNCNFTNLGEQGCGSTYLTGEIVNNMGIVVGFDSAIIENCTFDKFGNAGIAIFADGRVVDDNGVIIRNNTFNSCDYALNCYYGGNSGLTNVTEDDIGGKISFINNTVTGTSELRSKVCILDQGVKGSIGSVDVSGNTFSYTMVVVENMDESPCTVNNVLAENNWSNGSFYVEADAYYWAGTYQGTLTVDIPDYVYYESPENDNGYWVLNVTLEEYSSSTNTEYVKDLIEKANASGSHTLSITYDNEESLVDTITALKDCIYWQSVESGDLTISKEVKGTTTEEEFEFNIELDTTETNVTTKTSAGTYNYTLTYATVDQDGKAGNNITFILDDENSSIATATVSLKAGESITIQGLPAGATYTVTEKTAEGYTTSSTGDTGTIVADTTVECVIINTLDETEPTTPTDPTTPDETPTTPDDSTPITPSEPEESTPGETTTPTTSTETTPSTSTTETSTNDATTETVETNVKTGDETQVIGLCLLGGLALIGAYYTRKKKI